MISKSIRCLNENEKYNSILSLMLSNENDIEIGTCMFDYSHELNRCDFMLFYFMKWDFQWATNSRFRWSSRNSRYSVYISSHKWNYSFYFTLSTQIVYCVLEQYWWDLISHIDISSHLESSVVCSRSFKGCWRTCGLEERVGWCSLGQVLQQYLKLGCRQPGPVSHFFWNQ